MIQPAFVPASQRRACRRLWARRFASRGIGSMSSTCRRRCWTMPIAARRRGSPRRAWVMASERRKAPLWIRSRCSTPMLGVSARAFRAEPSSTVSIPPSRACTTIIRASGCCESRFAEPCRGWSGSTARSAGRRSPISSPAPPRRGAGRCAPRCCRYASPGGARGAQPVDKPALPNSWCGREDSNFHGLSATATSTLRVYQFRHDRTFEGMPAGPAWQAGASNSASPDRQRRHQ